MRSQTFCTTQAAGPITNATSSALNKRRRLIRKTMLTDDNPDIFHVNVEALKFKILGRKLETSLEGNDYLEDEFNYFKRNQEEEKDKRMEQEGGVKANTTTAVISSRTLESLQHELMCPICHDVLLDPLSLPCGHSFCNDCLSWWASTSTSTSTSTTSPIIDNEMNPHGQQCRNNNPKCPTCRTQINNDMRSLKVNTCLRSCVVALFSNELQARVALNAKTISGENDGAHSGGYAVTVPLLKSPRKFTCQGQTNGGNVNVGIYINRSVVMDSGDQRMRLALAVYGPIQVIPNSDDDGNNPFNKAKVTLCLLQMEEDEAEEGMPFLVQPDNDEAEFITREDRFSSLVDLSLTSVTNNGHDIPSSRRQLGSDGIVAISITFDDAKRYSFSFHHKETGLELILQISNEGLLQLVKNTTTTKTERSANRSGNFKLSDDSEEDEDEQNRSISDSDDDESKGNQFVFGVGGRDIGEYEKDDFVVSDEDDEDDTVNSHDACFLCGNGGELLICDGGDHSNGCRRAFHIACVGLTAVPDGDWICSSCAEPLGLGGTTAGHEFPEETCNEIEKDGESDCEFDMVNGEGKDSHKVEENKRPQRLLSKRGHDLKRRVILESDDDEEDD
eukprot:scaffold45311_cov75-Attheya_sp.AAC.1